MIKFITLILFSLMWSTSSAATYQEEYKAYNSALEKGHHSASITHAKNAWLAAEKELGNNKQTGILAYNYASLIYEAEPSAAIGALESAIKYTDPNDEAYKQGPPKLLLAYSKFLNDKDNKKYAKDLSSALSKRKKKSLTPIPVEINANYHLAYYYFLKHQFRKSIKHSDLATFTLEHFYPNPKVTQAGIYAIGAIARIMSKSGRNRHNIERAIELLDKAVSLYPAQKDFDSLDPGLAGYIAWTQAADAIGLSDIKTKDRYKTTDSTSWIKWASPKYAYESCGIEWERRSSPKFPIAEIHKGRVAGIFIGYDIHEDGHLVNLRAISEVPSKSAFSDVSIKEMKSWKIKPGFINSEQCTKDRSQLFKFIIQ